MKRSYFVWISAIALVKMKLNLPEDALQEQKLSKGVWKIDLNRYDVAFNCRVEFTINYVDQQPYEVFETS